ncbi:acyl-CoA thioesterase [Frankia sp. Cr2]|uniref:acyl-CoA thioesterase n=1 Tax=Frankia sp. Cr2 TaxID=3073932 RepID=UPI002AD243C7|nr:acyl-CoA thioesterase domain-containing protein [Frankia sp. Cr2]
MKPPLVEPIEVEPIELKPYGASQVRWPVALDEVLGVLDVQPATAARPGGSAAVLANLPTSHGGILGAQLVGQQVVLAERLHPGKRVQSLQTLFLRSGTWQEPLEAHVEQLQQGRSFASVSLTFRQGQELICKAQVLLTVDEPDLARTAVTAVPGPDPQDTTPVAMPLLPWDTRLAAGGTWQAHDLWMRRKDVPDDATLWRALVAYTCEPTTLPLLMADYGTVGGPDSVDRPHTALIVALTVTFFEDLDVRDWHVVRTDVPYTGGARVHGRGQVLDGGGRPRALFTTVGLFRPAAGD